MIEKKLNKIEIYPKTPEFARICINSKKYGKTYAIINTDDIDLVKDCTWGIQRTPSTFYAVTSIKINNKYKKIKLHQLIMDFPKKPLVVDHRSGLGLDNRRLNLRICSTSENGMNRKPDKRSSSRFKGVHFNKHAQKWRANIKKDGKQIHLGTFESEIEAAKCYDIHALKYFGEHARLNFPI